MSADLSGAARLADNLIRDAIERGEFDNLEGAGKPLPDVDEGYDPMWWIKKKIAAERLTMKRPDAEALIRMNDLRDRR